MDKKKIDLSLKKWQDSRLIKEITDLNILKTIIKKKKALYLGIDPTSDSLHIGHLVPIKMMQLLNQLGCQIIIVIGDSTARIGDPSFRSKKRTLLTKTIIANNTEKIRVQVKKLLPQAKILLNTLWYKQTKLIDFLTEIGNLFTVNKILEKESLSNTFSRDALFYSDFSYILLQAYDFHYLWKNYNCSLQIGGSDQYPNIVFGTDLIRKLSSAKQSVCGVTTNLLLNARGQKISKTSNHQIWLDFNKTSFHQNYQFFYNLDDATALAWFKQFNFAEIKTIPKILTSSKKKYQHQLFINLFVWVFDKDKLNFVAKCLKILRKTTKFSKKDLTELELFFPNIQIDFQNFKLWELIKVTLNLTKNKAFELIKNKTIKVNDQLIDDPNFVIERNLLLYKRYLLIKKGKKEVYLVTFT